MPGIDGEADLERLGVGAERALHAARRRDGERDGGGDLSALRPIATAAPAALAGAPAVQVACQPAE